MVTSGCSGWLCWLLGEGVRWRCCGRWLLQIVVKASKCCGVLVELKFLGHTLRCAWSRCVVEGSKMAVSLMDVVIL